MGLSPVEDDLLHESASHGKVLVLAEQKAVCSREYKYDVLGNFPVPKNLVTCAEVCENISHRLRDCWNIIKSCRFLFLSFVLIIANSHEGSDVAFLIYQIYVMIVKNGIVATSPIIA